MPEEMSLGIPGDRFEREIRLAASLQHPHLVPVLNAGSAGDVVYYVMPYIEGDSLAARIARDGALPLDDAIRILRDVLDALAYAHARGVVHRDIKPDNILLSGRHALVTDFGVAKAVTAAAAGGGGTTLTSTGMALGTPAYMAPEQAAADPRVDARADPAGDAGGPGRDDARSGGPLPAGHPRRSVGARHAGAREDPRRPSAVG